MVAKIYDRDGIFFVFSVRSSCLCCLLEQKIPFELWSENRHKLAEPTEGEVRVHGTCWAQQKAQIDFIKRAAKGIWLHGRGLAECYRNMVLNERVKTAVEWAILVGEIRVCDSQSDPGLTADSSQISKPGVFREFVRILLDNTELVRNLLGEPGLKLCNKLRNKDEQACMKYFRQFGWEKTRGPVTNVEREKNAILVLSNLLALAGKERCLEP